METPAARPHILRMTRWFGLAGVVHGIVGAGILAVTGSDSYKNRAIAGCTAGLAMGISSNLEGITKITIFRGKRPDGLWIMFGNGCFIII
jgi:hypothetical protein